MNDIVAWQIDAGLDVICDGEQGKSGFLTYVSERLGGFEPREKAGEDLWKESRETLAFPEFYQSHRHFRRGIVAKRPRLICTGPITYTGREALQQDIENIKAATEGLAVEEVFMTAISPSDVEGQQANEYYASEDEYLGAIAEAMHEEYSTIVDAGLVLQVDDPRLLTYYNARPGLEVDDCRRWAEKRVEVINYSLRDIPSDRIRFHTCYGINIGPRVHELNLRDIVDIMLKVNAGAYSFELANPRHEHEWKVWEDVSLPEGKTLIPGVISHSTPLVEHPELVCATYRATSQHRRQGKCHRWQRLRFLIIRQHGTGNPSHSRVGEIPEFGRRREDRFRGALVRFTYDRLISRGCIIVMEFRPYFLAMPSLDRLVE